MGYSLLPCIRYRSYRATIMSSLRDYAIPIKKNIIPSFQYSNIPSFHQSYINLNQSQSISIDLNQSQINLHQSISFCHYFCLLSPQKYRQNINGGALNQFYHNVDPLGLFISPLDKRASPTSLPKPLNF